MGGNCKRHLIIFTRFPEAGTTKTRLIPVLGAQGAAQLQRRMTEHILTRLGRARLTPEPIIDIRFEGGDAQQMRSWLGLAYGYRPQGSGHLGRRMSAAFEDAFQNGADQAVLIGTDIPGITPAIFEKAFDSFARTDVILGPAADGGYYLIGLSRGLFTAARSLFKGPQWGTGGVLATTLQKASRAGLRTCLLDELPDVDRPDDLAVWERETMTGGG